jgi:hypothetical protein
VMNRRHRSVCGRVVVREAVHAEGEHVGGMLRSKLYLILLGGFFGGGYGG